MLVEQTNNDRQKFSEFSVYDKCKHDNILTNFRQTYIIQTEANAETSSIILDQDLKIAQSLHQAVIIECSNNTFREVSWQWFQSSFTLNKFVLVVVGTL